MASVVIIFIPVIYIYLYIMRRKDSFFQVKYLSLNQNNVSKMVYYVDFTTSTNDDARGAEYGHMDVVWAGRQSAGRGQRGHTWHSREGDNLTFSVVLTPTFLPVVEQFMLSEVVALALVNMLAEYGVECRIKWTNDIYAGDNKIAGVLIEQSLSGDTIARTIVGIGLNVNQREFPADLPNPTSMVVERGAECDRREVLDCFLRHLEGWYARLEAGERAAVEESYRKRMYHLDQEHTYALASGERFRATIRGVRPMGHLRLEHADGVVREYAFKEVEFVLKARKE
jgi:BirA family biotin operon repressor/biotin-[acetyl-CoA-carboxylase] ligase